ncbi:transcription factor kayak-like [Teleopsis dalmanni]|uniref:transcription factor kayak-like n=1 Tax=Teleopsis dalmanni TaxID=139649 RepID=UPI0018CD332C|nr:transcription factor kayak-like [Teleopsis dalmanni]
MPVNRTPPKGGGKSNHEQQSQQEQQQQHKTHQQAVLCSKASNNNNQTTLLQSNQQLQLQEKSLQTQQKQPQQNQQVEKQQMHQEYHIKLQQSNHHQHNSPSKLIQNLEKSDINTRTANTTEDATTNKNNGFNTPVVNKRTRSSPGKQINEISTEKHKQNKKQYTLNEYFLATNRFAVLTIDNDKEPTKDSKTTQNQTAKNKKPPPIYVQKVQLLDNLIKTLDALQISKYEIRKNNVVKCALCKENHTANYKGCTVYKTLQIKRFPALRAKQQKTTSQNNEIYLPTKAVTNLITTTQQNQPAKTYAEIIKSHPTQPIPINNESNNSEFAELQQMMKRLMTQVANVKHILTILITKLDGQK